MVKNKPMIDYRSDLGFELFSRSYSSLAKPNSARPTLTPR